MLWGASYCRADDPAAVACLIVSSMLACSIPCHKTFIAHYEHALADPQAFVEPLAAFLELDAAAKTVRV
jgi:hypothetical protein